MQSFRDPVTGVLKAYGFAAANAPGDLAQDEADDFALEPGKWKLVAGAWVQSLSGAQAQQIGKMYFAYEAAIAQDVSFTTAALVTKMFQADPQSVANAQAMLAAYKIAVPAGFYWVSRDNTQVAFTLADLQGLAKAMGDQGWGAFQTLQTRKASILAGTTIAAVQAVVW